MVGFTRSISLAIIIIIGIRTVINETVGRCPERTALGIKRDGAWVTWTYRQKLPL